MSQTTYEKYEGIIQENKELKKKLSEVLKENENLITGNLHLNGRVQDIAVEMNAVTQASDCILKRYGKVKGMLWYFAHPYSGDEFGNFDMCADRTGVLLSHGYKVYSPICHMHPIEQAWEPQSWEFWLALDKLFVDRCDGLILAPGWEDSKGCRQEKVWFEKAGKPIKYFKEISNEDN